MSDMSSLFNAVLDTVKDKVSSLSGTELEKKVKEATSNENWGASNTLLREIARHTYDYNGYREIMPLVWQRMSEQGKNWRIVFKSLTLLEQLCKFGSERVVDECKERIFQIKTLMDFRYNDPATAKDCGTGIREKSKQLYDFLNDNSKIKEARAEARKNADKYRGFSSDNFDTAESSGSSGRYSGYGNDSYSGNSGNSGSRYDDDSFGRDESPERKSSHKSKSKDSTSKSSKTSSKSKKHESESEEEEQTSKKHSSKSSKSKPSKKDDDFDFGDEPEEEEKPKKGPIQIKIRMDTKPKEEEPVKKSSSKAKKAQPQGDDDDFSFDAPVSKSSVPPAKQASQNDDFDFGFPTAPKASAPAPAASNDGWDFGSAPVASTTSSNTASTFDPLDFSTPAKPAAAPAAAAQQFPAFGAAPQQSAMGGMGGYGANPMMGGYPQAAYGMMGYGMNPMMGHQRSMSAAVPMSRPAASPAAPAAVDPLSDLMGKPQPQQNIRKPAVAQKDEFSDFQSGSSTAAAQNSSKDPWDNSLVNFSGMDASGSKAFVRPQPTASAAPVNPVKNSNSNAYGFSAAPAAAPAVSKPAGDPFSELGFGSAQPAQAAHARTASVGFGQPMMYQQPMMQPQAAMMNAAMYGMQGGARPSSQSFSGFPPQQQRPFGF